MADEDIQMTSMGKDIVDTTNYYAIGAGENLPNHSSSLIDRGRFVRQSIRDVPIFRTRQAAYGYAAHLVTLAENWLPDESGCEGQDFDTFLQAIRSIRS